ncbi:LOW QUALITY PROTEIN: anillin-like [Lampetra fluviatilis]
MRSAAARGYSNRSRRLRRLSRPERRRRSRRDGGFPLKPPPSPPPLSDRESDGICTRTPTVTPMDTFTQKLLERTRARRELLQQKMAEQGLGEAACTSPSKRARDPLTDTANSSGRSPAGVADLGGSPPKKRYSGGGDTENVLPRDPAPRAQPMPEKAETTHDPGVFTHLASGSVKTRMQKLAEQRRYWDGDAPDESASVSSPVSFNHSRAALVAPPNDQPDATGRPSHSAAKSRLANLAATINTWEDDLGHGAAASSNGDVTSTANKPKPATATKIKGSVTAAKPPVAATRTTVGRTPDKTPVKVGMTKSASGNVALATVRAATPERPYSSLDRSKPAVSTAAARQESQPQKSQATTPSQARPIVNKTINPGTPAQTVSTPSTPANGSGVKTFRERFEERCQQQKAAGLTPTSSLTPSAVQSVTPTVTGHAAGGRTITVAPGDGTRALHDRFRHGQGETAAASHADKLKQEREQELAMIRNRFQKGSVWANEKKVPVSDATSDKGSSVVAGGSVAKAPVTPAREGNGQKSVETVQRSNALASPATAVQKTPAGTESTSDDAEPGRRVRFASETEKLGPESTGDSDIDSRGCQSSNDVSDSEEEEENNSGVIDELFEDLLDDVVEGSETKGTVETRGEVTTALSKEAASGEKKNQESEDELEVSSMSLLSESINTAVHSPEQKILMSSPLPPSSAKSPSAPCSPEVPPAARRNTRARLRRSGSLDSLVPSEEPRLLYSIDAYRSQRMSLHRRSPVKQASPRRNNVRAEERPKNSPRVFSLRERLHLLTNEVNSQQSIMQQARTALGCCVDEDHGKGSLEEAEAERLLLISTEKHQALLAELNRLKANASARSGGRGGTGTTPGEQTAPCRGSVFISDIRLPLKPEFVCVLASRPDQSSYYFVVLLRQGAENIVATPLVAAHSPPNGDTLTFPTTFTVQDVGSDFGISLEVYCLSQKKDANVPEKKKAKGLTPKKLLSSITKSGSNLHSPSIVIGGGTRPSGFVLVGSHRLCLSSVGQAKFPLEKVQRMSPLEGNVYLKFQCRVDSSVEERGFLTMFEEVSGFGAWHRRWCVLSGNCLSYWTYPDDEKRKDPMARVNLATCVNRRVEPVNREFCARQHTLELVTVRSQHPDDRETLTTHMRNRQCVTKNWLSADSRDERNLWMEKFNQVLMNLRTWQPEACAGAATR